MDVKEGGRKWGGGGWGLSVQLTLSGGKVSGQNGFGKKFQVVFSYGLKIDYPFPQRAKCYWLYYSDEIKD